ncbi:MAG: hypothetical protein AAB225_14040 [Acidobacteriota bacterium]
MVLSGIPSLLIQLYDAAHARARPDRPGLGIALNEEAVRKQLSDPGYFEPTPDWDQDRSWHRLWT